MYTENGENLLLDTSEMKAQEVVDKVLNHVKVVGNPIHNYN